MVGRQHLLLCAACLVLAWNPATGATQLPVVLWHGMGDSCCASYSIGAIQKYIEAQLPGVFVHSISTGADTADDTYGGFYGSVNDQVKNVCDSLSEIRELSGGYNAVGFSQGGQFLRAVLERCQHTGPQMHTLITLGSQHQGIMNVPACSAASRNETSQDLYCWGMQRLLGWGAYLPWIRSHIVQAQYFKDPYHVDSYLAKSQFLADINNERPQKSLQYKDNLASLQRLVLFRFEEDSTVVPRDSAWFSFFDGKQLLPMEQTQLYQEDWVGLQQLADAGRIQRLTAPGPHMRFGLKWFGEAVLRPYLAANGTASSLTSVSVSQLPQLWPKFSGKAGLRPKLLSA